MDSIARCSPPLADEHNSTASERAVRKYVRAAKERIGCNEIEVMVPQQHRLGFEAEVDFGAVSFYLAGVSTEGDLFVMHLSSSGKSRPLIRMSWRRRLLSMLERLSS